MSIPEFGLFISDLEEISLCRRIYMELAKLEKAITGPELTESVACCDAKTWQEKYERLVYIPHDSHITNLMVVCVDVLTDMSTGIDRVENIDVRLFLREYYYQIKKVVCQHPEAQAYYYRRVPF